MAVTTVRIPTFSDKRYKLSISLEGQSMQFQFYWNDRCKQWHMDLRKEDQTPVILGLALVPQYPMCVDYLLDEYGLTGYFLILPINSHIARDFNDDHTVMNEFFSLLYVYES